MSRHRRGRVITVVTLILGVLCCTVVLYGCSGSGEPVDATAGETASQAVPGSAHTGASQITDTSQAAHATASTRPEQTVATSTERFTRENWAELLADSEAHIGARAEIVGRLLESPRRRDDGVSFQMYADPKNYDWNTSVSFPDPFVEVEIDDFVRVVGTVEGAMEGENEFGESITVTLISADVVEVVDVMAAASPAVRTAQVGQSLEQHGIAVTVDRVEFALDETRVFVEAANGSGSTAGFYDLVNAEATQDGTVYPAQFHWDYYPAVSWELPPGETTAGIVVFPPMDATLSVEILLQARSEDYDLLLEPFVFEVAGD